ncbi:hypothetical protein RRF57_003347 [Xylaria bambusicola]|uniref:Uncharacterized protein n=1 Tax=Xylaria bambusicola TaxID=326684 RepID=A0AAN7Z2P6_9PEZI
MLSKYGKMDDFQACPKPLCGDETCFKVHFDPNLEPCYAALSLVVSGPEHLDQLLRRRHARARGFYLALEIPHKHLVRNVAWPPGNYKGYDMVATAGQDGFVRVFRIDTPYGGDGGKS